MYKRQPTPLVALSRSIRSPSVFAKGLLQVTTGPRKVNYTPILQLSHLCDSGSHERAFQTVRRFRAATSRPQGSIETLRAQQRFHVKVLYFETTKQRQIQTSPARIAALSDGKLRKPTDRGFAITQPNLFPKKIRRSDAWPSWSHKRPEQSPHSR